MEIAELAEGLVFENKIRNFLQTCGFKEVPPNRDIAGHTGKLYIGTQEIDAFGIYDGFYVIIDAKTKVGIAKKSKDIQSYLNIIAGYRDNVIKAAREKFEPKHGFRGCVFIFWVKDLKLNKNQEEIAKTLKIAVRDDFDLDYYNQAFDLLRNAEVSRNGFLKDIKNLIPEIEPFTRGTDLNPITIKTVYGSKALYTFPIEVRNLLKFAYVFRLETNCLLGSSYQRLLKKQKLLNMQEFILNENGYYPNNLIVTSEIDISKNFAPDSKSGSGSSFIQGKLTLPDMPCYLEVLDGQHRLYCYSGSTERLNSCLLVTIVEGLDEEEKAKLFIRINKKQTPVPPHLLWDLYRFSEPRSLKAHTSQFVYDLNNTPPLKDLICLPRVRSSSAYLSFTNLCLTLGERTKLTREYDKNSNLKHVIPYYLMTISESPEIAADWQRCREYKGKRGFICTNNSMAILMRLLLNILEKSEMPHDMGRIKEWAKNLSIWIIAPLFTYLEKNKVIDPDDPYQELRKLTSESARADAAKDIWKFSPLSKLGEKEKVKY